MEPGNEARTELDASDKKIVPGLQVIWKCGYLVATYTTISIISPKAMNPDDYRRGPFIWS